MNLVVRLGMKDTRAHFEILKNPPMTIQERAHLAYIDGCLTGESWETKEETPMKNLLKKATSPLVTFSGGIIPLPSPLRILDFDMGLEKEQYSFGCIITRKPGSKENPEFLSRLASRYGERWIDIGDSSGYLVDEGGKASMAIFSLPVQSNDETGRPYIQNARRFTLGGNGTLPRPLTTFDSFEADSRGFSKAVELYVNSQLQTQSDNERRELELSLSVIC
ncbi:MAG: hypothetical protein AABW79_01035 [Nanoarchaeota archaeon]